MVDWENFSQAGVGRPQLLINQQTLERFRDSLALVVALMGRRFGSPTGKRESGTEEELEWALDSHRRTGFPEVKLFFQRFDDFYVPSTDPQEIERALEQWKKVQTFKSYLHASGPKQLYYKEFAEITELRTQLSEDLSQWLTSNDRPWK